MDATRRRRAIRAIVTERAVRSQEELRSLLHRSGADVTQATLSRDLRALGAVKGPRGYLLADDTPETSSNDDAIENAIAEFARSAAVSAQLVVLNTAPGHAQPLALTLDHAPTADILGTIAGDDTIFIATPSNTAAARLARRWRRIIEGRS